MKTPMRKSLLGLAVAAAVGTLPQQAALAAKIAVKGMALAELVSVDANTINETQQGDNNGRSRWWIDASENLGNGMKAFARFSFQLDPSDGADEKNRDQYVGIGGGFGAIILGRLPTPYKMFGGVKWDPYAATFLQARRNGGMSGDATGHNGFVNDVLAYATPKGLGGFKATLAYVADENDASGVGNGTWTAGASWKGGPIEIIGAATHLDAANGDQVKVGVRYQSGGITAFVQYEDVDVGGSIRPNGNDLGTLAQGRFLLAGAGYRFGNNLLHANIGGFNADGGGNDVDYLAIGLTHFFSKTARVYAGYTNVDFKNVDDVDMIGAGLRFDFK